MKLKRFGVTGNFLPSAANESLYRHDSSNFGKTQFEKDRVKAIAALNTEGDRLTDYVALIKSAGYELSESEVVRLAVEMYTAEKLSRAMERLSFADRGA